MVELVTTFSLRSSLVFTNSRKVWSNQNQCPRGSVLEPIKQVKNESKPQKTLRVIKSNYFWIGVVERDIMIFTADYQKPHAKSRGLQYTDQKEISWTTNPFPFVTNQGRDTCKRLLFQRWQKVQSDEVLISYCLRSRQCETALSISTREQRICIICRSPGHCNKL